jgi:hypothetical protein
MPTLALTTDTGAGDQWRPDTLLPLINSPRCWCGENGTARALPAARVMARLIPDAQLGVGERWPFAYLDQFDRFRLLVGRFYVIPDKRSEYVSMIYGSISLSFR